MRVLATALLVSTLLLLAGCGGGSAPAPQGGALSGNWQLTLNQEGGRITQFVSGFLVQSNGTVTGSVVLPPANTINFHCSGTGPVSGTLNGQTVSLSINEGGSTLSLMGSMSADNTTITGSYATLGGACVKPTTGTWSASLIPPLTGNFTGTLSNSTYMQSLMGLPSGGTVAPIMVSGTMTQSPNIGAANATLTGTITAVGYPCFRTASLTGTVSGENVILTVFGTDGAQIGSIGQPGFPATIITGSSGLSLTGGGTGPTADNSGLILGNQNFQGNLAGPGPCPQIPVAGSTSGQTTENDAAEVALTFQ